ncbi:MAG: hypothetical protein R2746_07945 [Acidimicrobiales bacterium]
MGGPPLDVEASLDGRAVAEAGANDPIELGAEEQVEVTMTVTNRSSAPVEVRSVKLGATALGVTFVSYDTVVALDVPAGEARDLTFTLPIYDIGEQATGLVPGAVVAYDGRGRVVGEQRFTMDVDGSSSSLYGRFGLLLVAFTVATVGLNLWLAARRRLPPNRLMRGLRFAIAGVGLGLTLCFVLSALRILAPYPEVWPPLVIVPGLGFFLLGLLSPGRLRIEEDEIDVALREHAARMEGATRG